jgi:hypothetical protein
MINIRPMSPRSHKDWELVKHAVKQAAPPTVKVTPALMDNIRKALLWKEMSAWLYSNGTPFAVVLTVICEDSIMGKKELLLYCVAHLRNITWKEWDESYEKTKLYCQSQGCTHITAYTVIPGVARLAKRLGGDVDTRYISIPLGG